MRLIPLFLLAAFTLTGCRKAHPPAAQLAPDSTAHAPVAEPDIPGKLLERIDAAPYSYLRIKTEKGEIWAAVPSTKVEKGADVTVYRAMQMDGFESKTLKRTFPTIFFGTLEPPSHAEAPAAPHPTGAQGPADVAVEKVEKATGEGARTVSEIYAQKAALKEKPVLIRAKVVKFNPEVMGKNWLHLRDGSGSPAAGDHDLTVTTKDAAKVGDIVMVKGILKLDKDFGSGYTYPIIVEDAKVSK